MRRGLLLLVVVSLVALGAGTASAQIERPDLPHILPPPSQPTPPEPPDPQIPPDPPEPPDTPNVPHPDRPELPLPPVRVPSISPPSAPSPPLPSPPSAPGSPDPPEPPSAPQPPAPPDVPADTSPPDDPASTVPAEAGTSEESHSHCDSTQNGTTCHDRQRTSAGAAVDGVASVAVFTEEEHVEGFHNGSDGTVDNSWEDDETRRGVEAEVGAGPAPVQVRVAVTNGTRTHQQHGNTTHTTDYRSAGAEASVEVGGPIGASETRDAAVTVRERSAGDGYHRCEVDLDGHAAVGETCPASIPDDDGIPPGSSSLP